MRSFFPQQSANQIIALMNKQNLLNCALSASLLATSVAVSVPLSPLLAAEFNSQEQTTINVYRQARPAVVTIRANRSSGSGSIISEEGLVLTNEHVIRRANRGIVNVITAEGKTYSGRVITTDRLNDLALIQLQTQDRLPTLRLADASSIQVGQQVYAIGNPFGFSGTLTIGTLSRIAENGDLQTDAALNPGNSGGPLLNSRGEIIGVNKAIYTPRGLGQTGIGFATSAEAASNFITQGRQQVRQGALARGETPKINPQPEVIAPQAGAPRLGVIVNADNLVIESVESGSLADQLGLQPGDRIFAVNRRRLRSVRDLLSLLETRPESALITIVRNYHLATVRADF